MLMNKSKSFCTGEINKLISKSILIANILIFSNLKLGLDV